MSGVVQLLGHSVGEGFPVFTVAEVGLNHNGDLEVAKKLIDIAVAAGCDAVKFQKRTPEVCVPASQQNVSRDTPWGRMSYLEYRRRLEFGYEEFVAIDEHCKKHNIVWFASCWDIPSVEFLEQFLPPCHKIPSACLTNESLVEYVVAMGHPVILSTGMSTIDQIRRAVSLCDKDNLLIAHCTSTYPCPPEEANLKMIMTLSREFNCPVGYSAHEVGLQISCAAIALGACFLERHITLDRSMWGSDQAASVEANGLTRLIRDVRVIETALGDGVKQVFESELPSLERLRYATPSG